MFKPLSTNATSARASKKQKFSLEDSDDEFGMDAATEAALLDEGEHDLPWSNFNDSLHYPCAAQLHTSYITSG